MGNRATGVNCQNGYTFFPSPVKFPESFYKSTFPTPGTLVIPILTDLLACGKQAFITSLALSRWSGLVLSIKVIALLNAVMLPDKIPVTNCSADGCSFLNF
jgi:hypothetical protein